MGKHSAKEKASNKKSQHKSSQSERAREVVPESEAPYRQLIDAFPDPVVILQDDRYQFVNPAFTRLFGYTRQEMDRGLNFLETIQEQHRKAARQRYEERLAGKQVPTTFTIDLIAKDGTLVPCETSATMIQYQGRPADLVITRDITERKRAEEALDFERQQLVSIFDSIDEAVYVSDPNTYEVLYVNDAIRKLFGPCVGQKCHCVLQDQDSPCPFCTNDRIFGENAAQPYIWEFQNTLNRRWYHCIARAIRWPDGRMVRYEMAIDITEHKRAEEVLKESEARYQELFDSVMEGIGLVDENEVIQLCNPAYALIFDEDSVNDLTGKSLLDYVPEDQRGLILSQTEIHKSNRTSQYEVDIVTAKNHRKTILASVSPRFHKSNRYVGAFGAIMDITQRKQAEEELRKTTDELRAEREELAEKNSVLRHILEHIEEERQEYKQRICQDVEQVVTAVLARLQEKVGPSQADTIEALQENLKAILAKDIDVFRERYARLTPRELEICDMIKEGLSSKEISEFLNLSLLTVHKHREEIRRKLGITNTRVNLSTYLRVR